MKMRYIIICIIILIIIIMPILFYIFNYNKSDKNENNILIINKPSDNELYDNIIQTVENIDYYNITNFPEFYSAPQGGGLGPSGYVRNLSYDYHTYVWSHYIDNITLSSYKNRFDFISDQNSNVKCRYEYIINISLNNNLRVINQSVMYPNKPIDDDLIPFNIYWNDNDTWLSNNTKNDDIEDVWVVEQYFSYKETSGMLQGFITSNYQKIVLDNDLNPIIFIYYYYPNYTIF